MYNLIEVDFDNGIYNIGILKNYFKWKSNFDFKEYYNNSLLKTHIYYF